MRTLLLLLASTTLLGVPALHAQVDKPQTREGFWIGLGLGAGSLGFGGDYSDVDAETGFSGYLRLGGTLSQQLLLGVETNGWTKSEEGVTTTGGFFGATVVGYPSATAGFFLKGGLGLFSISDDTDVISGSGTGFAMNLGVGYDFRLGQNFSLTPYVNWTQSFSTELKIDGEGTGTNFNPRLIQFGLGVTWH